MLQSATIEIVDFLVSTIMFAFVLSRIDNYKLLFLVFEVQTLCRDFFMIDIHPNFFFQNIT